MQYENYWRPAFEIRASAVWAVAALAIYLISQSKHWSPGTWVYPVSICLFMSSIRLIETVIVWWRIAKLYSEKITFITLAELQRWVKRHRDKVMIGYGFEWGPKHTQRAYQLQRIDLESIRPPFFMNYFLPIRTNWARGVPWIHGVNGNEKVITRPVMVKGAHTLLVGTTGSGKTVKLRSEISQAIFDNDCVIIIDPKGDHTIADSARRACELSGRSKDFLYFHAAKPEQSCRIDVLNNWSRVTQIATRITSQQASTSNSDPFRDFSWRIINIMCQAQNLLQIPPNLVNLKKTIEQNPSALLAKLINHHLGAQGIVDIDRLAQPYLARFSKLEGDDKKASAYYHLYIEKFRANAPSDIVDSLGTVYEHNRDHYSKMTASLLPVLEKLTSDYLKELLSPTPTDMNDTRPIAVMDKIVDSRRVLYVGLDSLGDQAVGSAIGSMLIAALATVASERYNSNQKFFSHRVSLIIDEAPDVLNAQNQLIQLLNKSRAAEFTLTLAIQTISDLEDRAGSRTAARRLLGNITNLYVFRTTDIATQEYCVEQFSETSVKKLMQTQNTNSGTGEANAMAFTGGFGERMMEEDVPLFPATLLSKIPDNQCICTFGGAELLKLRIPILETD